VSKFFLTVDGWHPARLNQLMHCHWSARGRLKRADRQIVGLYARVARIPPATGKRRVSIEVILAPRQRAADPDAYWKSLLDGLVHAGLLLDDNRQSVELGSVTFRRGKEKATVVVLEDMENEATATKRCGA
jgi:Holliday junction resolvase RusA-like endonuclease